MSTNEPRLLITGSSGQLGRLVIEHLRRLHPNADITAMTRKRQAGLLTRASCESIRRN